MAWNRPTEESKKVEPKKSSGSSAVAIIGVAAVAVIGVVCYFLFFPSTRKPTEEAVKESVEPVIEVNKSASGETKGNADAAGKGMSPANGQLESDEAVVAKEAQPKTNKNVTVIAGSSFKSATDQLLAMATLADSELPAPPLPIAQGVDLDQEFLKSLEKPIEILETDSERTRMIKEKVIGFRDEVKSRMEKGEKFADILADHQAAEMENYRIYRDASIELRDIIANGDIEGAENYVETLNEHFRRMGVKELKMPSEGVRNKIIKSREKANKETNL